MIQILIFEVLLVLLLQLWSYLRYHLNYVIWRNYYLTSDHLTFLIFFYNYLSCLKSIFEHLLLLNLTWLNFLLWLFSKKAIHLINNFWISLLLGRLCSNRVISIWVWLLTIYQPIEITINLNLKLTFGCCGCFMNYQTYS